jgi:hypothetical protein
MRATFNGEITCAKCKYNNCRFFMIIWKAIKYGHNIAKSALNHISNGFKFFFYFESIQINYLKLTDYKC